MSNYYYLNKDASRNPNHNHEVHTYNCQWMPSEEHREFLGYLSDCTEAVKKAKEMGYTSVDGCKTCCPLCHKG